MSDTEAVTRSSITSDSDREDPSQMVELASGIQERLTEIVGVLREWRHAAAQTSGEAPHREPSALSAEIYSKNVADDVAQSGMSSGAPNRTAVVNPASADGESESERGNSGVAASADRAGDDPGADAPAVDTLATAVVQQTAAISNWSRQQNVALRNAVAAVEACVRELVGIQQTTASLSESLNQMQQSLFATGERARAQRLSGR